ncbi:hypothetical protein RchiOBHm_Chr3g0487271 [Rosa chinensis]|uniref:Uncharacterized protein n=1 Tax=Rosa chinensis TaxID=74649 RepID=A0A2P6RFF4_ROSCH|nr:hypothetical protein RchiOBHm_Chr3g0487271 [Rosa chinensis]
MAEVLSLWWLSERLKLMAAPSAWWSPVEICYFWALTLLDLNLGWVPYSSGALGLDGPLVRLGAWKIDFGPGLFWVQNDWWVFIPTLLVSFSFKYA